MFRPPTTAARLSATFPFISPIARPARTIGAVDEKHAYHLADGGYYDNHGVATAIDFLRDVLPLHASAGQCPNGGHLEAVNSGPRPRPAVVLIQIRAGEAEPNGVSGDGFRHATLGPVDTLMKVRTSTQIARNDVEVELLADAWSDRVDIASCVFNLGKVKVPLSWHLTRAERRVIDTAWSNDHQRMLEQIIAVLAGKNSHASLASRLSACNVHEPTAPANGMVASANGSSRPRP